MRICGWIDSLRSPLLGFNRWFAWCPESNRSTLFRNLAPPLNDRLLSRFVYLYLPLLPWWLELPLWLDMFSVKFLGFVEFGCFRVADRNEFLIVKYSSCSVGDTNSLSVCGTTRVLQLDVCGMVRDSPGIRPLPPLVGHANSEEVLFIVVSPPGSRWFSESKNSSDICRCRHGRPSSPNGVNEGLLEPHVEGVLGVSRLVEKVTNMQIHIWEIEGELYLACISWLISFLDICFLQ